MSAQGFGEVVASRAPGGVELAARSPATSRLFVAEQRAGLVLALAGFLAFVLPGGAAITELGMRLALLTLVPALLTTRPWQTLGRPAALVTAGCLVGAMTVLGVTGWAGANFAYYVVYALLAYVVVVGYATTPRRRVGVAVTLCSVALVEFLVAWRSWLTEGNPGALMTGSLHWHNQFAAFLLGPGLLAATVYVRRSLPRLQVPAAVMTVACATGIVLSTSRAGLGLLALGWLAVGYVAWRGPDRRSGAIRWLSVPLLVLAATYVLTRPLLFGGHHYAWPLLSADSGRGASTMVSTNTARLTYVQAALQIFAHHPVFGAGFGAYPAAAVPYLPHGTRAIFGVYNAWVDGLMAGGLVYGGPLLAAGAGVAVVTARAARRAWRGMQGSDQVLAWGVVIGAVAVFAHIAFDADTYYPAVITVAAVLVGLAHALTRSDRPAAAPAAPVAARQPVET